MMNARNSICYFLLGMTVLLLGCATEPRHSKVPNAAAQGHIHQIVESLPADSSLRRTLEAGHFANGIHQPWMDDMKRQGVKSAMLEVHGVCSRFPGFHPQATRRYVYRKDYDGPGTQITDERVLDKFRQSGLQGELQKVAFEKSKQATSLYIDSPPKNGEKCFVNIFLFDDEWLVDNGLLSDLPGIGRYDPEQFPLHSAVAVGDKLNTVKLLASRHFAQEDLNTALFRAVKYPSDNTDVISLLIRAGADVNVQRDDGTTPLMDAVARLNLSNIKLLISSGADIDRETRIGWTAYSLAQQQIKQFQQSGTRPPEYMPEILKLLKPSSTKVADWMTASAPSTA